MSFFFEFFQGQNAVSKKTKEYSRVNYERILAKTLTSVQNGACPYKKFFSPKYENKNNKIRG